MLTAKPSKRCVEALVGIGLNKKQYDALAKSLQRAMNEACLLAKEERDRRGHPRLTAHDMKVAIGVLIRGNDI